ncbi:LysR family transcriptional regulator [Salipaludibacillus keqinensis]|uniref:LysR family transcriptional regulator n=1 Tax=Salipaludibacillus keqinensis TaxID=2045207 RepID=A0A323TCZ6_9BACI|nr:LysR family transcriptional regulator [Salipaludibacillus keqinensis]PYZ92680.1 LysR family transcriptional regulator [Salipaludibacillus keqinensis]
MNLHALRYFLEVADSLNFSKAAKKLHISQPGLSQQIAMLEDHFNFKLLVRTTRNVRLTKEGKFLYEHLLPSFENIEKTLQEIEHSGNIPQTKINIAAVPSAASNWIPHLLNQLKQSFGEMEFYIQETSSAHVIDLVKNREYDIGLFRTPTSIRQTQEDNLKILEFSRHKVQLVLSSNHPLASCDSVNLYDLKDETFLHYDPEKSPSLHSTLEHACLTAGFIPKTLGIGPELLTIANLISHDIGVTLMPTDMIDLLPSHQIQGVDIKNQNLHSSISVVWNNNSYIPPLTLFALETFKKIADEAGINKEQLFEE